MLALNVGLEIEGAVLIRVIGSKARPDDVYRTYIHMPMAIRRPKAKARALSPSAREECQLLHMRAESTSRQSCGSPTVRCEQPLEEIQVPIASLS